MSVPKLRFPEFRDAGKWEIKLLKSICSMQAGKFISASNIFEKGKGGIYPCYGGNGLRGYTKTYTHSGRYSLIGRQGALCGNVNLANGDFYATEHAVVVTPKEDINVNWLFYKLDLLNLNRYATGQAQPGLSVEVLERVQCIVPTKESEQQKIADCLSSLDDRITAETQKLDTLKAHKKGLMQQLFPTEGETLPKLHFPEFSEKWREISLGGISDSISSGKDKNDSDGKYDLYGSTGIIGKTLSDTYKGKFLLVARVGANAGLLTMTNGTFGVTDNTLVVCLKKIVNLDFIYYYLESLSLNKLVFGSGQPLITGGQLKALHLFLPDYPEQQKIADCLTSIDEAIAAQSQAIELLKLHKKGLMQQLFPSIE